MDLTPPCHFKVGLGTLYTWYRYWYFRTVEDCRAVQVLHPCDRRALGDHGVKNLPRLWNFFQKRQKWPVIANWNSNIKVLLVFDFIQVVKQIFIKWNALSVRTVWTGASLCEGCVGFITVFGGSASWVVPGVSYGLEWVAVQPLVEKVVVRYVNVELKFVEVGQLSGVLGCLGLGSGGAFWREDGLDFGRSNGVKLATHLDHRSRYRSPSVSSEHHLTLEVITFSSGWEKRSTCPLCYICWILLFKLLVPWPNERCSSALRQYSHPIFFGFYIEHGWPTCETPAYIYPSITCLSILASWRNCSCFYSFCD